MRQLQQKKLQKEERENISTTANSTSPVPINKSIFLNELEEETIASTSYCNAENEYSSTKSCDNCQENFETASQRFLHVCPIDGNSLQIRSNHLPISSSSKQLLLQCKACSLNFHSLLKLHDHNCASLQLKNSLEEERCSAPPQVCPINFNLKRNSECRSVPSTLTLPPFQLMIKKQDGESSNSEVSIFYIFYKF